MTMVLLVYQASTFIMSCVLAEVVNIEFDEELNEEMGS